MENGKMEIQIVSKTADAMIKYEIRVAEFDQVTDMMQHLHTDRDRDERYFNYFIYKNIILQGSKLIAFYKIAPKDEIYYGKLDYFLQPKDFILDAFIVTNSHELLHLIVDCQASIGNIRSKINIILTESVNSKIWDVKGSLLDDDFRVNDIDKIIMSANRSFNECIEIHDRYLHERYFSNYFWGFEDESLLKDQLTNFCSRIDGMTSSDHLLRLKLSELPLAFRKSKFLFYMNISAFVYHIMERRIKEDWENNREAYIGMALGLVIYVLFLSLKVATICSEDSWTIRDIVNAAVKNLSNPANIKLNWSEMFQHYFQLGWVDNITESAWAYSHGPVKLSMRGAQIGWYKCPKYVQTVSQAKSAISDQIGIDRNQLYLIRTDINRKSTDDDKYKVEKHNYKKQFFEVVLRKEWLSEEFDWIETKVLTNNTFVNIIKTFEVLYHQIFIRRSEYIKFLQWIAESTSSIVYMGTDEISKEQIVIKRPKEQSIENDIKTLSVVNFPCFKGLYNHEQLICVAMEYVPNGTLESYIQKQKGLPEREIALISYQLLCQIDHLHNNIGRRHCDIKSKNIMFDKNMTAKLIDYGLSITEDESDDENKSETPGTMCYMAPDLVFDDNNSYTNKIDIWSFGVTVYEMLTGHRPYAEIPIVQAHFKILDTKEIYDKSTMKHVSAELREFLDMCLNPDPKKRASAEQLLKSRFILKYC